MRQALFCSGEREVSNVRDDNSELRVMPDFGCRVSGPFAGYKDGTPKTECEGFGSGTINMDLFSEQ